MRSIINDKITYIESPVYEIAEIATKNGYLIANANGVRVEEPDPHVVGILKPRDSVPRKFLPFLYHKEKALHLGTLWVNSESKGASPDEKWVLHAYGRDSVEELTSFTEKLIGELSEPGDIHIDIHLGSETQREEKKQSNQNY